MWDGHLGQIKIAKICTELASNITQLVHSVPYQAVPRAREFENAEIDKMLPQKVIEPDQTEWTALIVHSPEKDGSLRFCVDYRKLNAVTKRNLCTILWVGE